MTYVELVNYLKDISDKKFADFSKTLSNSDYIVLGVKNPILREFIKKHKDDRELDLDSFELGKYLEVDFVYFGLTLSRLNNSQLQLKFLKEKIRYAKSWAITDCVSTYVKKLSFNEYYEFFKDMHKSKYTYDRRMAYVLGLKQYKDSHIVDILPEFTLNEEYMVMMAQAWLLSVVAITNEDAVFNYLKDLSDITLKRKTISKICDSFRFSSESKERFKSLR